MLNLVREVTGVKFLDLGNDVKVAKKITVKALGFDPDRKGGSSIEACPSVGHVVNEEGCKRVAVNDINVHYGLGTAKGFYQSDNVLMVSLHMDHGLWGSSHPQQGSVDELGVGKGNGYNLIIPLPNGTGDRGYDYAMNELVVLAV